MIKDELKELIKEAAQKCFSGVSVNNEDVELSVPKNTEYGDIASNISFKITKDTGSAPDKICEKLFDYLFNHWPKTFSDLSCLPPANGYINFRYTESYYKKELTKILKEKEKYGSSKLLNNKKIQIEFISANPTGPLTLANGRGGFGGDVLANILEKAGAKVEREYLINDGGNQVKILGDSILVAAGLAVDMEEEIYRGDYINEWVEKHREDCQRHKDKPQELGRLAANDILEELIKKSIKKMKIDFDKFFSEDALIKKGEVQKAIKYFQKKGLTYEAEGAIWFRTTDFGDDKDRVLIKADGENTYFANDSAYHWDKFYIRKFNRVINLWGADHHGYVNRMMAATDAIGYKDQLEVIIMQMVRLIQGGSEIRMSKRNGTYVTMDDLLELIGGTEPAASDVARFFFLSRAFNTHMDFDLDLAREQSDKNPVFYVKYAYARISGILRNAASLQLPAADLSLVGEESEINLIKEMAGLSELIESIATDKNYPIHLLTSYAINLASHFHVFYDKCRVIDQDNMALSAARLELVHAVQIVLGIVAGKLIGIDTPEKM